jgi:hypothetical protein
VEGKRVREERKGVRKAWDVVMNKYLGIEEKYRIKYHVKSSGFILTSVVNGNILKKMRDMARGRRKHVQQF